MRLDYIQKLTVECSNSQGVNPSDLNPLIKQFREALENLRLQKHHEDLKGRIVDIDNFRFEQPSPNLVIIHWQTKWDILNMSSERVHDSARSRASRLVKTIEIQENGTLMKVIDIG